MQESVVQLIQQVCLSQRWTVSLAESCTGGRLAARFTCLPGCSQYFLGSLVAYSNDVKVKLLGVEAETLATHGAVSQQVVEQMAQRILHLTGSDYSLAVTGIAGPEGGLPEKPVGTVWGAMASQKEDSFTWRFYVSGTRQEIMERSVDELLAQFWQFLKKRVG